MTRTRPDPLVQAALVVLLVGLVVRFVHLGSDPTSPLWSGWLGDEGRWTEIAHESVSFGVVEIESELTLSHLLLAPLFQASAAASRAVLGPGLVPMRLVSAVAGLVILVLAGLLLSRGLGRPSAVLGVALLAVHPDLVYFSRVAIPEVPALAFQLAALAVLVGGATGAARGFVAGLLFALAAGFKGTVLPVLPAFLAVIWFTAEAGRRRDAVRAGGAFLAAVLLSAAVPILGLFVAGYGASLLGGGGGMGDLFDFLAGDTPYGMLSTLHDGAHTVSVNLLLALVWVPAILAFGPSPGPRSPARRALVAASLWGAGWIAVWMWLEYFPARYLVHILLPLLLVLALAGAEGVRDPEGRLPWKPRGVWRVGLFVVLALPLAFALGPGVANALDTVGLPFDRFRHHLVLGVALAGVLGVVASRLEERRALAVLAVLPGALALIWWLARHTPWVPEGFWQLDGLAGTLRWGVMLGGAALALRLAGRGEVPLRRFAVVLAVAWAVEGIDQRRSPTYVMREVGAFLDERYDEGERLGTIYAASVFLGTHLAWIEPPDEEAPPVGLLVFWGYDEGVEVDDYTLVREFPLDLGDGFLFYHEFHEPPSLRLYEPAGARP